MDQRRGCQDALHQPRCPAAVWLQTARGGSPWESGHCESFNPRFRDELLNSELFYTLKEPKIIIEQWRQHYKRKRHNRALGWRPPVLGTIAVTESLNQPVPEILEVQRHIENLKRIAVLAKYDQMIRKAEKTAGLHDYTAVTSVNRISA